KFLYVLYGESISKCLNKTRRIEGSFHAKITVGSDCKSIFFFNRFMYKPAMVGHSDFLDVCSACTIEANTETSRGVNPMTAAFALRSSFQNLSYSFCILSTNFSAF